LKKISGGFAPGPPTRRKGDGREGKAGRGGREEIGQGVHTNFQDVVAPMMKTAFFLISGPPNETSPLQKQDNRLVMIIYILYYS
jgi:hypothetical protein